jgi:hypothetical protein
MKSLIIAALLLSATPAFAADAPPASAPAKPACVLPNPVQLSQQALSFLYQSTFNPQFKVQVSEAQYEAGAQAVQAEIQKQCKPQ